MPRQVVETPSETISSPSAVPLSGKYSSSKMSPSSSLVIETSEDFHACRGPLEYLFRWRGLGWHADSDRESRLQLRLM